MGYGQTYGTKKTEKGGNPRLASFGAKEGFYTFNWISWLRTAHETGSTQALASWTLVTPPVTAAGRCCFHAWNSSRAASL